MFDPETKILVVDDMATVRRLVLKACMDLGFSDFVEAKDGREAWERLTQAHPPVSLILSDWNMPNSTGLDLLKRVRSEGRYKDLPFILMTPEVDRDQVVEALDAGVSDCIFKPFTSVMLREKLAVVYQKLMGP